MRKQEGHSRFSKWPLCEMFTSGTHLNGYPFFLNKIPGRSKVWPFLISIQPCESMRLLCPDRDHFRIYKQVPQLSPSRERPVSPKEEAPEWITELLQCSWKQQHLPVSWCVPLPYKTLMIYLLVLFINSLLVTAAVFLPLDWWIRRIGWSTVKIIHLARAPSGVPPLQKLPINTHWKLSGTAVAPSPLHTTLHTQDCTC